MPDLPSRIETIETFQVPPRWILVRVTTADGAVGWGEAIVAKRARAVVGAVADLADNVVGRDARRIEDLWQRMHRGGFFRGGPILGTAAAAVEQALWDRKARAAGLAVHEFLGGAVRERVRAYAWVGGDDPDGVVEHARQRLEQGFSAVKMNATATADHLDRHAVVDDALARVGSLRDAFGADLDIALDFHGRVPRPVTKILLRELEPFRLLWVEEPITPETDDALRHVASVGSSVPVATGERLTSRWDVLPLLRDGVVDVLQPDVSITGLFELEKIARMAEVYDVAVAPHCPNGPVSLAASLQVGFCCPNVAIQEQSGGIHYHQGYDGLPTGELFDYLRDPAPLTTTGGYFHRGDAAGLGIDVDDDAVRASAGAWSLPDPDWTHHDGRYAEW
ncbi:galactonate dehydratase [Haloactinopolyspora alba]|uniref:Galactonate dehydratase n=1 Tax=Haloactinopolyspora alba TaxID=648780 RepID=A0A2P8EG09_9ACTN|nr:galactonate dehydratase [Haloactinopolyspora alba]PSL08408.1 galactonate dehydratase [Haloactinopolyspora alba]